MCKTTRVLYHKVKTGEISPGMGLAEINFTLGHMQAELIGFEAELPELEISTKAEILDQIGGENPIKKLGPNADAQQQELRRRISELKLPDGTTHRYHVIKDNIADLKSEIRLANAHREAVEALRRQEDSDRKLRLQTNINLLKDWELTLKDMELRGASKDLEERCKQLRTSIDILRD